MGKLELVLTAPWRDRGGGGQGREMLEQPPGGLRAPAFREPVEVGRSPEEQGGRLPTFRPGGAGVWERTQPRFGQHTGQLL